MLLSRSRHFVSLCLPPSILHTQRLTAELQKFQSPSFMPSKSYSWPNLATMFPQRGTIRRKLIHRESFRASVLAPTLATTRCEHVPDTRIAYFLTRDVSVAPTGREHAYAAIAIMSSLVSFSTTGFISSVHSPCRFPACIS